MYVTVGTPGLVSFTLIGSLLPERLGIPFNSLFGKQGLKSY